MDTNTHTGHAFVGGLKEMCWLSERKQHDVERLHMLQTERINNSEYSVSHCIASQWRIHTVDGMLIPGDSYGSETFSFLTKLYTNVALSSGFDALNEIIKTNKLFGVKELVLLQNIGLYNFDYVYYGDNIPLLMEMAYIYGDVV